MLVNVDYLGHRSISPNDIKNQAPPKAVNAKSVVELLNISEAYRKIYEKEIMPLSKGVILTYSPLANRYFFQPISHNTDEHCIEQLSTVMRRNLLFYCYGEDEVVTHYQKGTFSDLDKAAKFAYRNRLPERLASSDGLPGEVLLDLLVQLYEKNAYKLAVRPILRQNDNNEIRGYDLTYFIMLPRAETRSEKK